jgi:ATPase family AAA domain-containing protein 3A/B
MRLAFNREQLKKQEEMVARQEAMRRKTAELEAELRTKTELAKAKAEAEGRIRQERENHDLVLDKLRLEAKEHRDTVMKAVDDAFKQLGAGVSTYLDDKDKLRNTAFTLSAVALGIYTAKTGTGVAGRFIEVRLQ